MLAAISAITAARALLGSAAAAWLALLPLHGVAGEALRVTHFPEAAYFNERVSLVLEGEPGSRVKVEHQDGTVREHGLAAGVLELNLRLRHSGVLRLRQGQTVFGFRVVQPGDPAALEEHGGYLYANGTPAILLARHVFPPKHNRTWETVRLIRRLFRDTRPTVRSGLLAGGAFLSQHDPAALHAASNIEAPFWERLRLPDSLYQINALIAGRSSLKDADMLLVALSPRDHERGIHELTFAIKLDWFLQAAQRHGIEHVFVAPPPFTARQREAFPRVAAQCRLSAESHQAHYVDFADTVFRQPLAARTWFRPVMRAIRAVVRCESPQS